MVTSSKFIYKCVMDVPSYLQSCGGFQEWFTRLIGWLKIYTGKCAFGFLEFPVFLIGCWHNCVSPLSRALEAVDGGHMAGECQEFTLQCGESQFFHTTHDIPGPLPTESGMFKKVMHHFHYWAPRPKHFKELRHCKITPVWLKNTYMKRMWTVKWAYYITAPR